MDPFSLTVGALGITGFALSSISNVRQIIDGLEEANDVLQEVTSNLEAIQRPLSALTDLQISDSKTYTETREVLEKTGVAEAVNKCGQACATFMKKLEQWTKHSSTTKLSLRDRLSVGLWNKEKIQTFRTQVLTCQAIVQFAIDSAQLVILVRSENASKTARQETEKQLRALENAIQEHIELTKRKQDETLQRKKELETEDEDEDEDGGAQRTLAIQEIEERSRVLEANQTATMAVSQTLLKLSVAQVGNTYNTDFSGSTNNGLQIGHSVGTINWNSVRSHESNLPTDGGCGNIVTRS
ncbi:Cytochrome P450 [Penicillium concentricum]|uniref:Cytochrome P450 n=1 Tax=Penicillium concentricum TaxID=293559 RepID=A0A9W9SAD6_9EURO|nr:Cytochrome P450 [Penicillium concentricum]KAJ5372538.1 Cytochrome P450 [Penicillium concentricum]